MTELLDNGRLVKAFQNLTPDEALPDALLEILAREAMNTHDVLTAAKGGDYGYTISIRRGGEAFTMIYYALLDKEKMR